MYDWEKPLDQYPSFLYFIDFLFSYFFFKLYFALYFQQASSDHHVMRKMITLNQKKKEKLGQLQ